MTRHLPLLLLLLAFIAAHPRCIPARADADWQGARTAGELVREGSTLRYELSGEFCWQRELADPRPYKIVTEGSLPLVVSMDGLVTTSWAAGATPRGYTGMLPLRLEKPLYALSEISPSAIYTLPQTLLLAEDGTVLLDAPHSELLLPSICGRADACRSTVLVASSGEDADALYVYGSAPQLAAYALPAGTEEWSMGLSVAAPAADIELLCASADRLLLLVLYDYEWAELQLLDGSGQLLVRHPLAGQLASNLVYPGPAEEHAELSLEGEVFELLVIMSVGGFEHWSISLADGSLQRRPAEVPATRLREENPLPAGGSGSPGPASAPFVQRLLPEQSGENWRIPALCDGAGRVFVVDGAEGKWL